MDITNSEVGIFRTTGASYGGLDPVDTNRCVCVLPPGGMLVVWIQQWHESRPFSTNPTRRHLIRVYQVVKAVFLTKR